MATVESESPRAAFKKARRKSLKEINSSVSRSPMSNKLQSCVDLENASVHQHTGKVSPSQQTISARGYENVNSSNIV